MIAPKRGEIWWASMPFDAPGKGPRPVIIVSDDGRNLHPRASSVLVIPLTTSIHKTSNARIQFEPGETGLSETSAASADSITTLMKSRLQRPHAGGRGISNAKICTLATLVRFAMDCD